MEDVGAFTVVFNFVHSTDRSSLSRNFCIYVEVPNYTTLSPRDKHEAVQQGIEQKAPKFIKYVTRYSQGNASYNVLSITKL